MAVRAEDKAPDIDAIIDEVDKLYRSSTSYSKIRMNIVTPNWERTLDMDFWTEGMDKTFILINSPKKDRGTTTLRIDKDMWNYFPKINKVMRVPPSMMMGSWMGSDFTNDDLVKESTFLDDYTHELIDPPDAKPEYYYIALVPKPETVTVWAKVILIVNRDGYLPVKQVYYDEKGKEMRIMVFRDVKIIGGRKIPTVTEMTPLSKKGHKTTITYLDASFDKPLPKGIFTMKNLQKKR